MTEQTPPLPPAGWFPDPHQPGQQRYWDGAAWTEHVAPGTPTTGQQLNQAGQDLADGVATAFTKAEGWFQQQRAASQAPGPPTFEQIAAGCRDEDPREPLSHEVQALVGPHHVDPVRRVFAEASVPITGEGATLERPCRLAPNPWNPAAPGAVAVLVGPHLVGQLPPDAAAAYGPGLVALSQRQLLATGVATLTATYDGRAVSAHVALRLPEAAALA